jgi:hypothetical protein
MLGNAARDPNSVGADGHFGLRSSRTEASACGGHDA